MELEQPGGAQFPDATLEKIEEIRRKVEQNPSSVSNEEIAKLEDEFNEGMLDVNVERSKYLEAHPEKAQEGEIEQLIEYFGMMKEKMEEQKTKLEATEAEKGVVATPEQGGQEIAPATLERFNKAIEMPNIPEDEREKFRQEFLSRAAGKDEGVTKGIMGQIMLRAMKRARELK